MHGYRPPTTVGPTIGSVGERMFAFTMNRTAGVLGERFVNITEYNNGWNKNQSIAGRTSGRAYSVIARNVGNAMYVLVHNPAETASNTPHSVSIYKFENNMWSTIIEAYVKPNEAGDSYVPIDLTNHDLAVDKDGNIYLGISYNLTPQVVKFDSSSKDFNLVATVFPKWHSRANYCRVAVSPIGILYVAYKDADNHLFTTSLDNKTKDWKTAIQLSTEAVDGFEFKFAENGTAYLAYNVDAEKVEGEIVSPAKIHLYKLATPGIIFRLIYHNSIHEKWTIRTARAYAMALPLAATISITSCQTQDNSDEIALKNGQEQTSTTVQSASMTRVTVFFPEEELVDIINYVLNTDYDTISDETKLSLDLLADEVDMAQNFFGG